MSSPHPRAALLPSPPQARKAKITHIPPPPIPRWALASRSAVAAQILAPKEAKAPPLQATKREPSRTPSDLEQATRPGTALLGTFPPRGSAHTRITEVEIQPSTTPAEDSEPDTRARQCGLLQGCKDGPGAFIDLLDRPRPKRVEARPNYRIRKTRRQPPKEPARSPSPSPRDIYDKLHPSFTHFICEWEGCCAELDNFAKLKKHFVVAHGEEVCETKRCRWGKCAHLDDALGVKRASKAFSSLEELLGHADSRHLDPILWHMGDGRRGHSIVTNDAPETYANYLFWGGCQVTPSVRHQKSETRAELRERQRKVKLILAQAYENAPAIEEAALEDSAEAEPLTISWG